MTLTPHGSSDLGNPERFSLPLLPAMIAFLLALNAVCALVTLSA